MLIRHIGHAEFLIETENGFRIITDPFGEGCGYPVQIIKADLALVSHDHHDHNAVDTLEDLQMIIKQEGVYTPAKDMKVTALKSFHDEEYGAKRGETLLFMIEAENLRIVHLGDLGCMPEEEHIRKLMHPDVLMIPVGGFYTIDAEKANEIVKRLKPVVTLPMHYRTRWNEDWPISGPEEFLESFSEKEIRRDIDALRITAADRECQPRAVIFKA